MGARATFTALAKAMNGWPSCSRPPRAITCPPCRHSLSIAIQVFPISTAREDLCDPLGPGIDFEASWF
jgi:hypothetical protein